MRAFKAAKGKLCTKKTEHRWFFDDEVVSAPFLRGGNVRKINWIIASENYTSPRNGSQGSLLTNKYAEGYPGKRIMGVVSTLIQPKNPGDWAGKRLLFVLDYANVQPSFWFTRLTPRYLAFWNPEIWSGYESGPRWSFNSWCQVRCIRQIY